MESVRENKILSLLEKYRQGLTIGEVANALKITRATASKDLAMLIVAGKIKERTTSKSRLHYLPKYFKEIKFALIFLLAGFFIFQWTAKDATAASALIVNLTNPDLGQCA